nr:response regulator [uncultured Devosia sp.]
MSRPNDFEGRRVLVVEDDYLIVAGLIETLQSMGAEVIGPISNVDQALKSMEIIPPIAGAVLDVSVQGVPVFPVADALAQRNIPFVFSTGYDRESIPPEHSDVPLFQKPAADHEVVDDLLQQIRTAE